MLERKIRLNPSEVNKFVSITSKCDFDVDIFYNRYIVDAKSFLGVMGMDFSKVLTVRYQGYHPELETFLKMYAVAC